MMQGPLIDGRYELLEELGSGGMGVVYKARDPMLNIDVAIKMLHKVNPEEFLRFQQEAKATARMNHPNMVKLLTFGMADDKPYMVMEYLRGRDLQTLIREDGPLSWQQAIPIFIQICDALAHAHKRGVLHRDLKSSNVLLTRDAQTQAPVVKILDFGISKITSSSALEQSFDEEAVQEITRGQVVGSPLYMSPEQIAAKKIDGRSDIYSMGCLMFETLTARTPFVGDTAFAIANQHCNKRPPTLRDCAQPGADFPDELEAVVAKSLAKLPASRFQTMQRLGNALRAVDSQLPGLPKQIPIKPLPVTPRAAWTALAIVTVLLLISGIIFANTFQTQMTQPLAAVPPKNPSYDENLSRLRRSNEFEGAGIYLSVSPTKVDLTSDDLKSYSSYDDFRGFDLRGRNLDKSAIDFIAKIPNIKVLLLGGCDISDAEIRRFAKLDLLAFGITECLNIKDFGALRDFNKDMVSLHVGLNQFTDKDLEYVRHMKGLRTLGLNCTPITDKGLERIGRYFPKLEKILLNRCPYVTAGGVQKLLKRNPEISVVPFTAQPLKGGARRRQRVLRMNRKELERSLLEMGEPTNQWGIKPLGDPFKNGANK